MPAIITHHLFGLEVYRSLASVIGGTDEQRNAFLLGNQGPDPLLCLKALPSSVPYRSIGTLMHVSDPTSLFLSMHRCFIEQPERGGAKALPAFALGFLCHYLLDSTVHPLVYAQQYALCDVGVPGLDREHGCRELHALIETELDEYLLAKQKGQTVGSFSPHREVLACGGAALHAISVEMAPVICDTYDMRVPRLAFESSVRLYRAAQQALDSKREGLRRYIDYARLAGASYLHVQALTHTDRPQPNTLFTNNNHFPWSHPFEDGAVMDMCFDDLYEAALNEALEAVPRFARQAFGGEDCASLVRHGNFYGQSTS